jgi:hypothetical protein
METTLGGQMNNDNDNNEHNKVESRWNFHTQVIPLEDIKEGPTTIQMKTPLPVNSIMLFYDEESGKVIINVAYTGVTNE